MERNMNLIVRLQHLRKSIQRIKISLIQVDLLAEGVLIKDEFLRKKEQLKERQYELTELIASYDKIDDKFSKKL